ILDPDKLTVVGRIGVRAVRAAVSAPKLPIAIASHTDDGTISLLDLEKRALGALIVRGRRASEGIGFHPPTISPPGSLLFSTDGERLNRFSVAPPALVHIESTAKIASGKVSGIYVSPDSKLVALTCPGGNFSPGGERHTINIHDVTQLLRPLE